MNETLPIVVPQKGLESFLFIYVLDVKYLVDPSEPYPNEHLQSIPSVEQKPGLTEDENWLSLAGVFGDGQDGAVALGSFVNQLYLGKSESLDMNLVCGAMIFPDQKNLINDFSFIMAVEFGADQSLPIAARAKRALQIMAALKRGGVEMDYDLKYKLLVHKNIIEPGKEIQVDRLIEALKPAASEAESSAEPPAPEVASTPEPAPAKPKMPKKSITDY